MIRVFILDDHQVVRLGIKTMLESEPDIEVVGMAASSREALSSIARECRRIFVCASRPIWNSALRTRKDMGCASPCRSSESGTTQLQYERASE